MKPVMCPRTLFVILALSACMCLYVCCDPIKNPTRTILVYLAGDNTISSEITRSLNAMQKGWEGTDNNIIIYHDTKDAAPRLLTIDMGKKRGSSPVISVIEEYDEENSASQEIFKRVLSKVTTDYRADSYGLIFASHSSGWLPEGTLRDPASKSLGIDNNTGVMSGREIALSDFSAAIPDGQFDYIIFESCLMAGVEVAYELRNKTKYIVASSAEMLAEGFVAIYPTDLMKLVDVEQPVESSLVSFAESYFRYINTQTGSAKSATISIIKTEAIDSLAIISATLIKNPLAKTTIENVWALQYFDRPGSYGDKPASPRYFDLGEYMSLIGTIDDYTNFENTLKKIVVWKNATPKFLEGYNGYEIKHYSGLTTYIEQDCFPGLNDSYKNTGWYKAVYE